MTPGPVCLPERSPTSQRCRRSTRTRSSRAAAASRACSTDGGQSFSRIAFTPVESSCPDGSHLAALWYISAQHGYLVLNDGSVFETTNGTDFATKTAIPGSKQANGGVVPTDCGLHERHRRLRHDLGRQHLRHDRLRRQLGSPSARPTAPVRAITFASATVGYAVGDSSLFLKTSDGGATWVAKEIGPGPEPHGDPLRRREGVRRHHRDRHPAGHHGRRRRDVLGPDAVDRPALRRGLRVAAAPRGRRPAGLDGRL